MNNEPVAWMNEADWMGGVELDVITDEFKQSGKGGDCSEYSIPLYTHPAETITLAELRETELYRKEQTRSLREFLEPKELTDEEILQQAEWMFGTYFFESIDDPYWIEFARAILRKAQEK